jgi:two-component system LytT family response regulator
MLNTPKINCIIVDDEEVDRLMLVAFLRRYPHMNICGVCSSAAEAITIIERNEIQILFTDIDMPGIDGFEFRSRMMNIPVCIFVTAFAEYALKSFELAPLDFLVKPLDTQRFDQTIKRITFYMEALQKAAIYEYSLGGDAIFVKEGHDLVKIKLHDIVYLEALKDYTMIFTPEKKYYVLSTIGSLLKETHFKSFVRIHRSYAVQKNRITSIKSSQIMVDKIILPVGRSYKDSLEELKP